MDGKDRGVAVKQDTWAVDHLGNVSHPKSRPSNNMGTAKPTRDSAVMEAANDFTTMVLDRFSFNEQNDIIMIISNNISEHRSDIIRQKAVELGELLNSSTQHINLENVHKSVELNLR